MMLREEQRMLEDLATRLFADHEGRPEDPAFFDEALWLAFTGSGLDRVLATETVEESIAEAVLLCCVAGRFAVRIPVVEPIVAHHLAHRAGWQEQSRLPAVVSPLDAACVPWGRGASIVYGIDGSRLWRSCSPPRVKALGENLAGEPRDRLYELVQVESADAAIASGELPALLALLRAAMMAGVMQRCVDLALTHSRDRVQFGKPIVQFQAVQQMLAQLRAQASAAQAAVEFAAANYSVLAAAAAKSRVGDAVRRVTDCAHEIAGAMGYSMEYPLQRLTRRLWAWRDEDGSEAHWNRLLGAELARRGGAEAWSSLSALRAAAR